MNNNGGSDCHHLGQSGTVAVSIGEIDSNLTGHGKQIEVEQDKQETEQSDLAIPVGHDSDEENFISEEIFSESYVTSDTSHLTIDTIETGLPDDTKISQAEDEALAVWVKLRGNWQAGIKCARADWPLSTLKAKPTHDRKEYLVIFFPRKKHYLWADVLLMRPIHEFPEPIAHKTHKVGLKIVKDLTVARRFIMQKLARSMLDIIEQFHLRAFIESARSVIVWREFGMEAARCKDYSDLGRMLVKLQNMIVQSCISSDWLSGSFRSWVQQCEDACTAESVEMLKEELMHSIIWSEINSLSDVAEQSELAIEWKTLKQEVMRSFYASNPDTECNIKESPRPIDVDLLQACRKRPKLEVRRAEAHTPQAAENVNTIEIDAGFFYDRGQEKWGEIVAQPENSEAIAKEMSIPSSSSSCKNRRCTAFIEAKGRQCVRWANDGDVYCCVHLTSRFSIGTPQEKPSPSDSPMCDGTTIHGTKCKHRALQGSTSCKKHAPRKGIHMSLLPSDNHILVTRNQEVVDSAPPVSVIISESREIMPMPPSISVIDVEKREDVANQDSSDMISRCIGSFSPNGNHLCLETPKRYLYCDDHVPSWLKRARNGKSRIVSKEVFVVLLKDCSTREQKLHLHQACELFYKLFKSILSMRNPVPEEVQLQWAIKEASKDKYVGLWLSKLVSCEIETLRKLWGFDSDNEKKVEESTNDNIVCKICSKNFLDDQEIATHWMNCHKKEAQRLFKAYMCAICLDSYKNKKILETHLNERHHTQFFKYCMLLQCIPCGGSFGSTQQLQTHVLAVHPSIFTLSGSPLPEIEKSLPNSISHDNRKFVCKLCDMRFNLLPDLGRHHRITHKGMKSTTDDTRPSKQAYKMKTNKIRRPRFKKGLRGASYRIRNRGTANDVSRLVQLSNLIGIEDTDVQPNVYEANRHVNLEDSQLMELSKILLSKLQITSSRPTNSNLLTLARSACCKVWLQNILVEKFHGLLPKKLYLKAVKLCSEHNIVVKWHNDAFVCSRGCTPIEIQHAGNEEPTLRTVVSVDCSANDDCEMDESHYVIDVKHLKPNPMRRTFLLCNDISFGQETVPIVCIADENLLPAVCVYGVNGSLDSSFSPWESFNYGRKSLILPSVCLEEPKSFQLGCDCEDSTCSPSSCDHVYLFDNDYEDAKDVNGKSMVGRFPYDENGRIILAEGYPVYECNERCSCDSSCQNRVLQNGIKAILEVFKTEKKGWGVRAGEPIMKGTFICEYIGQIINHVKPSEKSKRVEDWGYIQEIDNTMEMIEDQIPYMVDSKNYGNVSRFINHSCSPNLVSYQVLVESLDSQLTRMGLYASKNIDKSEELTYGYRCKQVPVEGIPCHCEAPNCRGRLY